MPIPAAWEMKHIGYGTLIIANFFLGIRGEPITKPLLGLQVTGHPPLFRGAACVTAPALPGLTESAPTRLSIFLLLGAIFTPQCYAQ